MSLYQIRSIKPVKTNLKKIDNDNYVVIGIELFMHYRNREVSLLDSCFEKAEQVRDSHFSAFIIVLELLMHYWTE